MALPEVINEVRSALRRAADLIPAEAEGSVPLNTLALAEAARQARGQQRAAAAASAAGEATVTYTAALGASNQVMARHVSADAALHDSFARVAPTVPAARAKLDALVTQTEAGIAALLPTSNMPAGRAQLVAFLQNRLGAAHGVLSGLVRESRAAAGAVNAGAVGYHVPGRHVDPQPPPEHSSGPPCWVPSPDDAGRYCGPDSESYLYVDKDGNWVERSSTGDIIRQWGPGNSRDDGPTVCWLAGPNADRSVCGPATTTWIYPDQHGNLVTERIGPGGSREFPFHTPYGPLVP